MKERMDFWEYLHQLLDDSCLKFYSAGGVRILPICTSDGWLTQQCVLVMGAEGKPDLQEPITVKFSCGAYTFDDADRIIKEIEKAAA
jgi:hypothetical protein